MERLEKTAGVGLLLGKERWCQQGTFRTDPVGCRAKMMKGLLVLGTLGIATAQEQGSGSWDSDIDVVEESCSSVVCPPGTLLGDPSWVDPAGLPATVAQCCTMCPVGTYNPDEGADACIVCPEGQFTEMAGSVACTDLTGLPEGRIDCNAVDVGHPCDIMRLIDEVRDAHSLSDVDPEVFCPCKIVRDGNPDWSPEVVNSCSGLPQPGVCDNDIELYVRILHHMLARRFLISERVRAGVRRSSLTQTRRCPARLCVLAERDCHVRGRRGLR